MQARGKIRTRRRALVLTTLTLMLMASAGLLFPDRAAAADPPVQPFKRIYSTTVDAGGPQRYSVLVDGIGMFEEDLPEPGRCGPGCGELTDVTIPGTSIVRAYLVWAGLGRDNDGVSLERLGSGQGAQDVTASDEFTWNNEFNPPLDGSGRTWGCCGNELSVYAADVSDKIVVGGPHTYRITGMQITHGATRENWGISLIVVYANPSLPTPREITIKLGNDGFFYNWGPGGSVSTASLGPYSDVQCVEFSPTDATRTAQFLAIVGGIEDEFRPNGLWGLAGNEPYVSADESGTWTRDVGLINIPAGDGPFDTYIAAGRLNGGTEGAVEIDGPLDGDLTGNGIDWPFSNAAGASWDEYPVFGVQIAPGDTWVCLQIESAARNALLPIGIEGNPNFQKPASIGFLGFISVIDQPAQESIDVRVEPSYDWTYTVNNPDAGNADQPSLQDVRLMAGPYVTVACPKTSLAVGESMTCTASSSDLAYYASAAWVVGIPEGGGAAVLDFVLPDPLTPQP